MRMAPAPPPPNKNKKTPLGKGVNVIRKAWGERGGGYRGRCKEIYTIQKPTEEMDDSISKKDLIIYLCTIFMYVPLGTCALIVEECCYVTHVRIVLYLCYSMYICYFRADCTSTNVCYLDAESISIVLTYGRLKTSVGTGIKTQNTTFYACMERVAKAESWLLSFYLCNAKLEV